MKDKTIWGCYEDGLKNMYVCRDPKKDDDIFDFLMDSESSAKNLRNLLNMYETDLQMLRKKDD